jgi:Tol biopolymer transport system component
MKRYLLLFWFLPLISFAQLEKETHLANIKQITFGGLNAEAYFSADGKKLIYQSAKGGYPCDRIFTMNIDGTGDTLVSTGTGRTTCAYFFPDGKRIIYASTHLGSSDCLPNPDRSHGYVWGVFKTYDIFSANADGSDLRRLTTADGYDAEGTISPDGKTIVFTSARDGDLEIYTMNADGLNQKRLTFDKGYDGGAFFSPDGKQIVYRAHHPTTPEDQKEGEDLLAQQLVKPTNMEIFVMNADGSNKRQITNNGTANFAPFFTPDGKRIIFSSNVNDQKGWNFDLYLIDLDGRNLEQVTYSDAFDGFPMFSPDGTKLVFASGRNASQRREINIFIADWK